MNFASQSKLRERQKAYSFCICSFFLKSKTFQRIHKTLSGEHRVPRLPERPVVPCLDTLAILVGPDVNLLIELSK